MAAFTTDWDTDLSSDSTDAIQIDDYMNKTRTDIEERLKEWVYGFVAGENDGVGGLIMAKFKEQAGDVTTAASVLGLYAKDDSGTCLYARPESNGTAVKIIDENGNLVVVAGDYAADSIDEDDIQLANDAHLTAKDYAGTGTVDLIKVGTNDLPTLPDSSEMASDAAPVEDEAIVNKKYVDDLIAAEVTARSFGAWTDKDSGGSVALAKDEVYKVGSDGFVVAVGVYNRDIQGYTDGSNPPTTQRCDNFGYANAGQQPNFTMPVRKDDYWKVTQSGAGAIESLYWLPIGSGTCVKQ